MLYPKNKSERLDPELFKHPTSEYRGTPFWSWNTDLKKDELLWQIERLREMGFGGYHIHVRSGMSTEYLSEDFMDLIEACVEKGKREEMLTWLYDEDRWPSGAAGGIVTKDPRFRQKLIRFSDTQDPDATDAESGYTNGKPYLLAIYDVSLSDDGRIKNYSRICEGDSFHGRKIYAYIRTPAPSGWYNGQTYIDTLDAESMGKFIDVTYRAYEKKVGGDFGKSIHAIFTDEPQFYMVKHLRNATGGCDAELPWTTSFDESFSKSHGYSIVDRLPEVIWNLEGDAPSKARYDYYDHLASLFANSFAHQCGNWCREHGISLTGHLMAENELCYQIQYTGETMRSYPGFGIPGIDILCDRVELTTAKQTQSAVHQCGKEAMLSELYGVTGWAFDFKGHKFQGDWQAALGVTVRVPHLSWVSMKGSAKRDYPASIHYQSSWYKKYSYVEDHFARLNTALTRGNPDVKIGVIHPIETQWLNYGPSDTCMHACVSTQRDFDAITSYLLDSCLDFDFVSESLLPSLYAGADNGEIKIGQMSYRAIVIPPVRTLRKTTVDALLAFVKCGGRVMFTSPCPDYVDGSKSDLVQALYSISDKCDFTKNGIVASLDDIRDIRITDSDGNYTDCFIYNMRQDGDGKWLFIARHKKRDPNLKEKSDDLSITVKGIYKPVIYDTMNGTVRDIAYVARGGYTKLSYSFFETDSLLLRLDNGIDGELCVQDSIECRPTYTVDFSGEVEYSLSEPNVMVLDICRYSADGESFGEPEAISRIDQAMREQFCWPMADGRDCQPWVIGENARKTSVYLRFDFESELCTPCHLAFEEAEAIWLNGENVPVNKNGWFTDKEIYTVELPPLRKGSNTLTVRAPISERLSIENMFLLGDFGVRVEGSRSTVIPRDDKLSFGSITDRGLPFYGAQITYNLPISLPDCDISVSVPCFEGAVIGVAIDGQDVGCIAYSPFSLPIKDVKAGDHTLSLTLYATRVNCFGALHNCRDVLWKGPGMYYSVGDEWTYDYVLSNVGILTSPTVSVFEK